MQHYDNAGMMRMMAMRQGLQLVQKTGHEMPARKSMVDYDDDFRWRLSASLQEWVNDNASGEVRLRFDPRSGSLIICADDPTDLTLIATAF